MRPAPLGGLVLVLSLIGLSPAAAQTATVAQDLLEDWQRMKQTMLRIADAMPEEYYDYASTPEQRNFGEQVLHVAGGNVFLMGFMDAQAPAPEINRRDFRTFGHTATSKAEILKILTESYEYGAAVLGEFADAALLERASGPPYMGQPTRLRLGYFVIGHAWDIYGQMAVYLRLNGVVPSASQRP